jgi:hypothetical protein
MKSFKYLGSKILTTGIKKEVIETIKILGTFYQLLRDILWKQEIPKKGKIFIFKS